MESIDRKKRLDFWRGLRLILFLGLTYFYLYNPVFRVLGIGSTKLVLVGLFIYGIYQGVVIRLLLNFKIEIYFTIILIFYSVFTSLRTGDAVVTHAYGCFIWFAESFFGPIVLVHLFLRELKIYGWGNLVSLVGIIAAGITLFLIFNLELNNYLSYRVLYTGANLEGDSYEGIRGFGFSGSLRGGYGMVQGMILGILLNSLQKKSYYTVGCVLIIISIAFNARTGLIALPTSLIILVFLKRVQVKAFIYLVSTAGVLISLDYYALGERFNVMDSFDWIYDSFDDFVSTISGVQNSSIGQTLFIDERFLPSTTFELFFGTGRFSQFEGRRVDNGYFYLLWFGGYFFMLIVMLFHFYLFRRIRNSSKAHYHIYFFGLLLIFYTMKSDFLCSPSQVSRLMGFFYVYSILNYKYQFIKLEPNTV